MIIKRKGLKQCLVSKKINVSESHLSQMLSGKRRMTIDVAYNLSVVLGITIDDVYKNLKA